MGRFYPVQDILLRINRISIAELRKELRAQILVFEEYDIKIDNLSDQNGVISIYNPFFEIMVELAEEFDLAFRSPILASRRYPKIFSNSKMIKRARQIVFNFAFRSPFKALKLIKYFNTAEMERKSEMLDIKGITHTDLFIESFWGEPTPENYIKILENLPEGTLEVVLHVGTKTREENYPSGLDLTYFKNREYELITCTSEYLKEYINRLNIRTINFSDLPTE